MEKHVSISVSAIIKDLQSCTLFIAETMGIDSGENSYQMWISCSAG